MVDCSKKRIAIVAAVAIVLAALIAPIAYFVTREDKRETDETTPSVVIPAAREPQRLSDRINCIPENEGNVVKITKNLCENRNCEFIPATTSLSAACVFPVRKESGFSIDGNETFTKMGWKVYLRQKGLPAFNSTPFKRPYFEVQMPNENLIRFKFDDEGENRFHVPIDLQMTDKKAKTMAHELKIIDRENFAFQIIRKSSGAVLFDTSVGGLSLLDQFLQLSTVLPSDNVYGFGENIHESFRHDLNYRSWPMFSRDQPPFHKKNSNLYGVHPFYTCVEPDGNTHGVLLLNSNAQDYSFTPHPMLTYRAIGGVLDFYMFLGPSPENVIQQYTQAIGRPFMPPYWSLGFQLCRYGYNSLENLMAAVNRTRDYGIPHDVQYADIDHMNNSKDFTVNQVDFAGLNDSFTALRNGGMRTVIMLDPCFVSNVSGYEPYDRLTQIRGGVMWHGGVENDTKDSTGAILGYVWPNGKVVFPDFFKNSTRNLWKNLVMEHRKRLIFDGLWIDMNEPANFGTNQDRPFNWNENIKPYWSLKCPENKYDDPPYRTMAAYVHDGDDYEDATARLSNKTLCMVATQGNNDEFLHYNVHSLYGRIQSPPTISALREASGERSMVLSRNTFPGSGKYVGHWLGDNDSAWPGLASSIIGMLEFNLFGIPYIGADICGFFGDTTVELCKRWMQLGAFYPFSRNHNTLDSNVEQDPGALGEEVAKASRDALETRYWLLPYLYTLFHKAHVHGNTVVRPIHHEFPLDDVALGIDRQFLWGRSLLISPILEQGQTELEYYVPDGRWYDFYKPGSFVEGPKMNKMPVDANSPISLHVRGGSILPMQEPARNTTYSRKNAMKLLVALDKPDLEGGSAEGELFWDDGTSIDTYENGKYVLMKFLAEGQILSMTIEGQREWAKDLVLKTVHVYGVATNVHDIHIISSNEYHTNLTYDAENQVLIVRNLSLSLNTDFQFQWVDGNRRIDCYPERLGGQIVVTEKNCSERNCLFHPMGNSAPDCFFPLDYGYTAGDEIQTETGWSVNLTWKGKAPFPQAINSVTFTVEMIDNAMLNFKIYDSSKSRYEVPLKMNIPSPTRRPADPRYDIIVTNKNPFHFQVIRKSTGTVLWDTSVGGLTFEDQFLQIATRLPSRNVYGFGENVHTSLKHDMDWTMWPMFARDQPPGSGKNPRDPKNLYGVHPFYTCMEEDGHSHGVLLLNSNSQDYAFTPLPMLIYRSIGGILDFYMFLGPEPETVIQQYTGAIGRPMMPPYWALGFQLCRYGYENISNLQAAVERTLSAKIPFDVQYADIDHMDEQKDFTIDQENFNGLQEYFSELRNKGMRTIIILDPCLLANKTYGPYQKMSNQDGLVKWPTNYAVPHDSSDENGSLLGYVWPNGKVVFPDFFKTRTQDVWISLITNHSQELPFDGLWIDMNEPANFGTNEERPWNWPANSSDWSLKCVKGDVYEDPPYRSMAAFQSDDSKSLHRISEKTICMVARQGENDIYRHYDVHNLYGWSQSKPTLDGLQRAQSGKRGLVISRSTFPGSGQYVGHWLGDNSADWDHLRLSVIGIIEFNLFGIPYIGADICGFFGTPSAELCKRWMQLGAFYTFSRNHNTKGPPDQDPAVFDESVTKASREAMETRYWLLPYLYTLFHHAHVRGNTVIRPLHHEFPLDQVTYGIDRQFLWGPALLISPILEEGQHEVRAYLPRGTWYDFYSGEAFNGNQHLMVPVDQDSKIPLHIRGGYVIPMQAPANNTAYSRKNTLSITVALSSDGKRFSAEGDIYFDDGESINPYESGNYGFAKFIATEKGLKLRVGNIFSSTEDIFAIGEIRVLGIRENITVAYINGSLQHHDVRHHQRNNTLIISNLALSLTEEFNMEWYTEGKFDTHELERINCYPDLDSTAASFENAEDVCRLRGCIWNNTFHKNIPPCYINKTSHGYINNGTRSYFDENNMVLKWKNKTTFFGDNIPYVEFIVQNISENVLRLKYLDLAYKRYEVPVPINNTIPRKKQDDDYRVEYGENNHGTFFVKVIRQSTNTVIWDTSLGGFTFAVQFLQMVVKLPSKNMYGFGENRHFSFQHDFEFKRWPMFSRDNGVNWGDYANLYGVHPFYLNIEDSSGNAHGVLLLNSNAMEIELNPLPSLTYRTIGGILDFYIFLGPTPEQVIQQYTSVIGHPYLPPYWSLGFQLCQYGYNNLKTMKAAVDRTKSADIPHDVQYADIDHMHERRDFTIDQANFGGLQEYFKELQSNGMRTIIILDPALITNVTGYLPYIKGVEKDIFIQWPNATSSPDYHEFNRTDMLGYVWPQGKVVFPDFLNKDTREYWRSLIVNHHENLSFDGLWIDMNEPANFGTNEEHPWNWDENVKPYWSLKCPTSRWDDPPYKPKAIFGPRLSEKTLCMIAVQDKHRYLHYDVHSLYGWSQTEPTLYALRASTGERGIVISRSTYPSSGRYAGHWLGDNDSAWSDLHDSVIGILEFNLFGIPYVGADICGFFGNSTSELCERWMQLGAFYTFSRNHNTINTSPQDPAYFGPGVAASSRRALVVRYTLLPYLYTLFYHAHVRGGTVIRSLAHNFPNDQTTWSIDTQFMWGRAFMITPVLQQGRTTLDAYFPVGRWFDYYTGKEMNVSSSFKIVPAPHDVIPLFVYGGHILPTQLSANTTAYSRRNPMGLLVVLNENESAEGNLFWDDGKSIDTIDHHQFYLMSFSFKSNKLSMTVDQMPLNEDNFADNLFIKNVTIYGGNVWKTVKVNDSHHSDFVRDDRLNVCYITNLNLSVKNNFSISFL